MEVNISQAGQNFALRSTSQQEPRSDIAAESEKEQKVAQAESEKKSKVEADFADTKENVEVNAGSIEKAVAEISEFVQSNNRSLQFSVDEASKRQVVKVTDSESGEVIRQIPSEEVLALSKRIKELQTDVGTAVGVLFNKQV
ncbi:flagellar protein FlaG [Aestuariibacter sp. AA17]|uniref:Flagellar protein FlaG n=1 Tax=Fluctibacter corallii TaxID=2984329 RepID=A0ABT3A9Z5_9ALTE|nr:flagellar protein FlaG [Aestuariibacter sp. AA17]MCV2885469.1 flagellar protein FlaG [Aestuariibacter sp. AA17]